MTHFRHCETFSKKLDFFLAAPPARINITARTKMTPVVNFYACGYCCDLMLCDNYFGNVLR